jgi:hypothetical protein
MAISTKLPDPQLLPARSTVEEPELKNITPVIINPGNLTDSRVLRANTPGKLVMMPKLVIVPLLKPLLKLTDPTVRTSAEAVTDIAHMAAGEALARQRGYFDTSRFRTKTRALKRFGTRPCRIFCGKRRWRGRDCQMKMSRLIVRRSKCHLCRVVVSCL